ncbi:ATP-dependent helicase [Anaerococcus porci]|uniref:ATP-dependent helicase n=1 Tax=Anaerococcus porci TaxID=2652269 RepID=UPI002A75B478|nr:ATP-dependent helicase [Anaerococcus porci]MDY3007122.1 ATP-dependent helicase [Anaerococcus porci]
MILTSKQEKAANHKEGPLLVLAIPGSGKTTMLLERIKILSRIIDKTRILSLTFSKIQAEDMKERSKDLKSNFMTIHAFCYLIIRNYLRKYNREIRLIEDEKIYNKYNLVGEIYEKINHYPISREDLALFFREVSFMKNSILDKSYLKNIEIKNISKIYEIYEEIKNKKHLLDFDDMQVKALEILKNDKSILMSIKSKYKYYQLDEGQDASLLQFKILEEIIYPENNILIVADDDQSIYSFRAANPSYLLNFKNKFENSKIMWLDTNHRSGSNIVNLSKYLIQNNKLRYDKNFIAKRDKKDDIIIKTFADSSKEYQFIRKNLKSDEKTAILFRNNISAISLIAYFFDNDIDFNVNINVLDFFESKIFKDLLSIIDFSNDFNNVELFKEIYYKVSSYLSKEDIEKLSYKAINEDIFDYFYRIELEDYKIDSLFNIEKKLKHIRKLSYDKKISFIYNSLSYKSYINMISRKYMQETVNKDLYIESAINFTKGIKTKEELLEKIEKLQKKSKSLIKSKLYLSTIHSSKGLEYDKVFVIDLIENEFPLIFSDEDRKQRLEEERRIFYVAITRAKNSLYILSLSKRNKKKVKQSIFYKESYEILKNKR